MSIERRPLKIRELLGRSFALFRQHAGVLFGIMAAPALINLLASLPFELGWVPPELAGGGAQSLRFLIDPSGPALAVLLLVVVSWGAHMIGVGAGIAAVVAVYEGAAPQVRDAYARMRPRGRQLLLLLLVAAARVLGAATATMCAFVLPVLLFATFPSIVPPGAGHAMGLFAGVGLISAFPVAVIVLLRYAVAAPALMVEELSATAALKRSVFLTRGFLRRMFVLLILAGTLTFVCIGVLQGPFIVAAVAAPPASALQLWLVLSGLVIGTIARLLTAPVLIIGGAVLYFDLRLRKDAVDAGGPLRASTPDADAPGSGVSGAGAPDAPVVA